MNRYNFHFGQRLFNNVAVIQRKSCFFTLLSNAGVCMDRSRKKGIGFYSSALIKHATKKAQTSSCVIITRRRISECEQDIRDRTVTGSSDSLPAHMGLEDINTPVSSRTPKDDCLSSESLSNSKLSLVDQKLLPEDEYDVLDHDQEYSVDILEEKENPEILEHLSDMPLMPETYTLASYVDHSETLQKLVQMGVDLSKVESRKGVASMLMRMDFDRDIKDKLAFLHHVGVPGENLGSFITTNPYILQEDLQNLEARVQYLLQKGFSETDVSQIVCRAPYFLNFSVERVDNKLGYYQQLLKFPDTKLRQIITRCPKLVTFKVSRPKENLFALEFQCGFSKGALHTIVLQEPSVLLRGKYQLLYMFDYLHNVMDIPHKMFLKSPRMLLGQINRVKDRHKFLMLLQRNQYDPTKPGYVPLTSLIKLPDEIFCKDIARTSLEEYERFLKTSRT